MRIFFNQLWFNLSQSNLNGGFENFDTANPSPFYETRNGNTIVRVFSDPNAFFFTQNTPLLPPSIFRPNINLFSPPYYPSLSSNISRCSLNSERYDFYLGTIRNGAPTAPAYNCYTGHLADQYHWFTTGLFLNNLFRSILVYRPQLNELICSDHGDKPPLYIFFHGTGGSSESMSHDIFNENEISRVLGNNAVVFILEARDLIPENSEELEDWEHYGKNANHYWQTTDDHGETNRDLMFVEALIRAAISQYGADPTRVFLVGHSNGGFAALQYGIALRHLVRGIAINSAGWVEHPPKQTFVSNSTDCGEVLLRGVGIMTRYLTANFYERDYDFRGSFSVRNVDALFPAARPVSVFPTNSLPAIYAVGNSGDTTVSPYYTCALGAALAGIPRYSEYCVRLVNSRDIKEGHHYINESFLPGLVTFFQSLPSRSIW